MIPGSFQHDSGVDSTLDSLENSIVEDSGLDSGVDYVVNPVSDPRMESDLDSAQDSGMESGMDSVAELWESWEQKLIIPMYRGGQILQPRNVTKYPDVGDMPQEEKRDLENFFRYMAPSAAAAACGVP